MREICTSGSMSGDGKRSDCHMAQATAPVLDSTPQAGEGADRVSCTLSDSLHSLDPNAIALLSARRRLGGELRAAQAHAAARILPQLLGRVQTADGARDRAEIVGCEPLRDVGVV